MAVYLCRDADWHLRRPFVKYGAACTAGVEHPALRCLTSPAKTLSSGAAPALLQRSNPTALIDLLECL